ncbi:hypothetical protein ABIB73_000243 [Bradyrhizobium sp. F1.4.3]
MSHLSHSGALGLLLFWQSAMYSLASNSVTSLAVDLNRIHETPSLVASCPVSLPATMKKGRSTFRPCGLAGSGLTSYVHFGTD